MAGVSLLMVAAQSCRRYVPDPHSGLLSPPEDPQDAQEQVDDIHIQCRRAVHGIIDCFWDPVGPAPVVTDIAAEYQHDYPIDYPVMDPENEQFNQLPYDNKKQGNCKHNPDLLEKGRERSAKQHHNAGDYPRDLYRFYDQRRVIIINHYVYNKTERHNDKVISDKTYKGVLGFGKKIYSQ